MNTPQLYNAVPYDPVQQERMLLAVRDGRTDAVADALKKGARMNVPDKSGNMTALHLAVLYGRKETMDYLLQAGCDPNLLNTGGHSALSLAVKQRCYAFVKPLTDAGAEPNNYHAPAPAPLAGVVAAMVNQDANAVMLHDAFLALMEKGANPNVLQDGYAPLHRVGRGESFYKREEVERLLLTGGADPNLPDQHGITALHYAAANSGTYGGVGVWNMLYAGGNAWQPNHRSQNLFHLAVVVENDTVRGAIQRYEKVPHFLLTDITTITKEKLFERNGNNACLLDDPQTWHHFDAVAAQLESRGERLSLEDLRSITVDVGISPLAMAARCFSLAPVCHHLAEYGERVSVADVTARNADGSTENTLQHFLYANRQVPALFESAVWSDCESERELKQFYQALAEPLRGQVQNLHALGIEIARHAAVNSRAKTSAI